LLVKVYKLSSEEYNYFTIEKINSLAQKLEERVLSHGTNGNSRLDAF
jgi:hypothetical protein